MSKIINLSVRNLNDEEIANIIPNDRDFPQIAITLSDETKKEMHHVYMYPLRGYFFQIGGLGAKGSIIQGDRFPGGADYFIKRLKESRMSDTTIESIFNNDAMSCILKYISKQSWLSDNISFRIDNSIGDMGMHIEDSVWKTFIQYTIEFFSR